MAAVNSDLERQLADARRQRSLWRNRDYLLLWSGQAVSLVGSQVSQFAFPLLALTLTGSPAITGVVAALGYIPYVLLSLLAGALADRWDRKRMMIIADTLRALSLGSIPIAVLICHLTLIQLCVVVLLEGAFCVFFNIAETASLPCVVTKEQLPAAVSQNLVTINTTSMLGPSLGGFLLGVGRMFPFLLDAISYAVSAVSLLFIKSEFQHQRARPSGNLWSEIREGMHWLWRHPLIRFITLICGVGSFAGVSMQLITIVIATSWHASAFVIGLIFGGAGLGSILGAAAAAPALKRYGFGRPMIVAAWTLALCFPFYLLASNLVVLGAITVVYTTAMSFQNTLQLSYRMTLIPDELQGRVTSVLRLIAFGGSPLGFVLTGALLQLVYLGPTVLLLFVITCLMAVASFLNPHIHKAPLLQTDAA